MAVHLSEPPSQQLKLRSREKGSKDLITIRLQYGRPSLEAPTALEFPTSQSRPSCKNPPSRNSGFMIYIDKRGIGEFARHSPHAHFASLGTSTRPWLFDCAGH